MRIRSLLKNPDHNVVIILSLGTILVYLWNLGLNLVWNPNEAFYAEAVREMFESGNFIDINYNYEPRYNKPPLLYWLIALSSTVFGLNEFAIRLPSALLGLGTIFLVYKSGRLLADHKMGIIAAVVAAFSFQFAINARYAAPAVPLTFFVTLALYWFLKGYHLRKFGYIFLGAAATGLAVLVKGYPYYIVIAAILGLYICFDKKFKWKPLWRELGFFRLHVIIPVTLLIGMSWVIYMWGTYGESFYEVFMDETFRRAFTRKSSPKPFYYIEANLWGFLPYSLTFYFGLIWLIANKFRGFYDSPVLKFSFSWFVAMLLIFTVAKGKIPTYFIQGYPGMALFTAWFIYHLRFDRIFIKRIWQGTFFIPALLFFLGGFGLVYAFSASPIWYLVALLPAVAVLFGWMKKAAYLEMPYWPFITFLTMYFLFAQIVLPFMEGGFRNQDEIGRIAMAEAPDQRIPIFIEERQIHSLPFYAERKVVSYVSQDSLRDLAHSNPGMVLIPDSSAYLYPDARIVWEGIIWDYSETRTLEFIIGMLKEKRGEKSRFGNFRLLDVRDE